MKYLDQILELWLPTKLSILIAGLSTTLGASAFLLPEFLNIMSIRIPCHLTLLIRIGSPLLLWLLGSLFVLHTVVQYSKTLRSQKTSPPPILSPIAKLPQLSQELIDILIVLFSNELLTFQIAQKLNMENKEEIVKSHLRKLANGGFIKEINLPGIGPPGQSSWFITNKGKDYLIENKLIS